MLTDLTPDAVVVERSADGVILIRFSERTIQPWVVYSADFQNGVYHQDSVIAYICWANKQLCSECIAVVEDCRNKEEKEETFFRKEFK